MHLPIRTEIYFGSWNCSCFPCAPCSTSSIRSHTHQMIWSSLKPEPLPHLHANLISPSFKSLPSISRNTSCQVPRLLKRPGAATVPLMFHLVSKRNVFLLELSVIHWNLPGRSGNPLKQRKNIKEMGHVYQISLLFSSENQSGERRWWCHYDIIDFGISNSELLSNRGRPIQKSEIQWKMLSSDPLTAR